MKQSETPDDLIPVTEFILRSERNLEIATAVFEQYKEAREQLLTEFLDRLQSDLEPEFPNWKFIRAPFFTDQWGHFSFYKPAWKAVYTVRLEAWDHGKRMIYGVSRDRHLAKLPLRGELLEAVREAGFPAAKSRAAFEAEIDMTSPAKCWAKPEILWRLRTDDRFRAEVKDQLLRVARAAERHVDDLAKSLK
jgi:hypothetical protein